MKSYLASAMLLVGASVLSAPVLAADPMGSTPTAPAESTGQNTGMTKEQIIGRAIIDPKGAKVGTVKDVHQDAQGAATNLVVSVGSKDVLMPASEVQVASNDKLQTTLSAKDVKRLPAASAGGASSPGATPGGAETNSSPGAGSGPSPAAPY